MRSSAIYSILFVFISHSWSNTPVNKETISHIYSNKLQMEHVEMNAELKTDLTDIYAHFDLARAKQIVLKCYENFGSIQVRAMRLKIISYEFQNKIDELLEYPLTQNDLNLVDLEMEVYRQTIIGLIDSSHVLALGRIEQINEKLVIDDFQKLQVLTQNEFNVEKELVKSKLLRTEFLVASQLLMELDLERSFF